MDNTVLLLKMNSVVGVVTGQGEGDTAFSCVANIFFLIWVPVSCVCIQVYKNWAVDLGYMLFFTHIL